jgi:hypothetical protein
MGHPPAADAETFVCGKPTRDILFLIEHGVFSLELERAAGRRPRQL